MSQVYKDLSSGPVPPSVPQSFVTDSGTATAAANVLNVLGNDTTDNDADGLRSIGSGNTVTYQLTNRLQGTATSTNASNADMITFSLGASAAVYRFQFDVTARDTGTGDGVGYTVFGSARTDGATSTIIASPFTDNDEDASLVDATISLLASANTVVLRGVGVAGQTINYSAVGTYVVV